MTPFERVKAAIGRPAEAGALLRSALYSGLGYLDQVAASKLLDKLDGAVLSPVRLAVLGSTTTAQLVQLLRLHAFKEGMRLEVYEAAYGTFQQEVLDPGSGLYAFKPQAVLFYVNYRDARPGPVEQELGRWEALWRTLQERHPCAVLMNNFDIPVERPLGNLEARREQGIGRLRRLNALLAERAPSGVCVLDQEHLSAVLGKERWHDPRFWHHSKQAMSFDGLTRYAVEAAALLKAVMGKSRKCLVLDLDNTLWGGVAGDDGAENLELGEEFLEFQHYAKALKERGVLLAVCSKNDERVAREVFLKRHEMVLKIDDFSAFIADWGDKAANLRAIAESLHIGLDALAFADDSPMERELVRRLCPEVAVVDLPEEPAEYARALDRMRLFETVSVSKEDSERAAHLQAEAARESLQRGSADLGAFLKDLEMEARACPFSEPDLERIVQLVNKTNQFNLTTKRTTEPETRALMSDPEAVTLALRLKDRFGDYGLVSVLVGRVLGESLEIETWLMSCRVLGRGLERLAFNKLLEAARSRKLKSLFGRYIPTAKNGLVKDHYRSLGFKEKGAGEWTLQVERASPLDVMISDASRDPR